MRRTKKEKEVSEADLPLGIRSTVSEENLPGQALDQGDEPGEGEAVSAGYSSKGPDEEFDRSHPWQGVQPKGTGVREMGEQGETGLSLLDQLEAL